MKIRPTFVLRFRDEEQVVEVYARAERLGISINELILRSVERVEGKRKPWSVDAALAICPAPAKGGE